MSHRPGYLELHRCFTVLFAYPPLTRLYLMPEELGPEPQEMQEQVMESLEQVKEDLAKEQSQAAQDRQWIGLIGLSTAILSALAAISAMQAGSLANEGMVNQIRATDQWALFQAKSTKRHVEESTVAVLQALGKPVPARTTAEIIKLQQDQQQTEVEARRLEEEGHSAMQRHESFARGVAALQIGISLGAVAALLRRKSVWYLGLAIAAVGVVFMGIGLLPAQQAVGGGEKPHQTQES